MILVVRVGDSRESHNAQQHETFEDDLHDAVGDCSYFRILNDLAEPPQTPGGPTSLPDEVSGEDMCVAVNREVEVEFVEIVERREEDEQVSLPAHLSRSSQERRRKLFGIVPVDVFNDTETVPTARLQDAYAAIVEKEKLTSEQRGTLEELTRDQHESDVWHAEHCGRITSSMIYRFTTRKATTEPDKLVADILRYKEAGQRSYRDGDARAHGHKMEPVALAHYLADKGDKVSVSRHSLFVSESHPFLATSTDGLVHGDDESGAVGVLEIKCPSSDQPLEILACARTDFCLDFDGSDFTVKKRHPYYHQLQMEMGITGCKWADLVVFTMTATGPSKQVKRVPFDPAVFNLDRAKAILFYKKFVVLELLTRRVQRRVKLVAGRSEGDLRVCIMRHTCTIFLLLERNVLLLCVLSIPVNFFFFVFLTMNISWFHRWICLESVPVYLFFTLLWIHVSSFLVL